MVKKTMGMLLSEAIFLKNKIARDKLGMMEDLKFTKEELTKAEEEVKNGARGYKCFF